LQPTRRELLEQAGLLFAASQLHGAPAESAGANAQDGWPDLTVPRVFIHEALRVDLA
jgi:hypothetical protein